MPEWKPEILRRLAPLKLSPAREGEIAEEIAQHLDDRPGCTHEGHISFGKAAATPPASICSKLEKSPSHKRITINRT